MTSQMETTRVLSGGVASWTGAGHWKSSVPWSACGWIQNSFRILWWCCNTICTHTHTYTCIQYTFNLCIHIGVHTCIDHTCYMRMHIQIYTMTFMQKKTYLLYIYKYICREYASGLLMFTSWFDGFHRLLFVCFTGCPTGPGVSKSPLSRMASPVSTGGGAKSNAIFGPWRCTWGYELV